jgi:hypothetical protein
MGIVTYVSIVSEHKIFSDGNGLRSHRIVRRSGNVGFLQRRSIYKHSVVPDFNGVSGLTDYPLDEVLPDFHARRWAEHYHIPAPGVTEAIRQFIYHDPVAWLDMRLHAGHLDADRLYAYTKQNEGYRGEQ